MTNLEHWKKNVTVSEFIGLINANCCNCPLDCGDEDFVDNTFWTNFVETMKSIFSFGEYCPKNNCAEQILEWAEKEYAE